MNKIRSLTDLAGIIENEKRSGHTIVLVNGCFDLIHIGHIRYLRDARRHGDRLVAAVNSDVSVRRLKGPGRPLLPEDERAEILAAFECVDFVTVFSEDTVESILNTLKPHVHVKGSDYTEDTVPEKDIVRAYGGKVAIAGGPKVRSTSDIVRRIAALERYD